MVNNKSRKFSIDLLRIIVMYFVVVLHVCNQSGIDNLSSDFYQQAIYNLYKTLTCVAVNVFAIISGYVGCQKNKLKLAQLTELWLITLFYGLIISIIMICAGVSDVGYKDIIKSFLPVTLDTYWYLAAYFGLFFIMPLINKLLLHSSSAKFFKSAIVAISVFSFYGIVGVFFGDPFRLGGGYSVIWLSIMYYIGAGIGRFQIEPRLSRSKVILIALSIWLSNSFLLLSMKYISSLTNISILNPIEEYLFQCYVSPAVVFLALSIFYIFVTWDMRPFSPKLLMACSASAFSVYLIHHHPLIWNRHFRDISQFIGDRSWIEMIFYIPGIAAAIFIACLIIDIIRAKVFHILKIPALLLKVETSANQTLDKIYNKCYQKFNVSTEETPPKSNISDNDTPL